MGRRCRPSTICRKSSTTTTTSSGGCEGPDGCYACPPQTQVQFLEACTDAECIPYDNTQLEGLLEHAAQHRLSVIPFGGGTSVAGGVEPELGPEHRGSMSVDLRALSGLLDVDLSSRSARIAGGTTGPALEAALGAHGLSLRHYPQSFEFSTLGGWIATRAGGHFATLHTHIDELVQSVRLLTPRGPLETRRLPGSGAGPAPERLVLGELDAQPRGDLSEVQRSWVRSEQVDHGRASGGRLGHRSRLLHPRRSA